MADNTIDYVRAGKYITEYYGTQESILHEFGNVTRDAITNFFLKSTVPEEKIDFSILGLLFDLAWVIAPEVKIISIGLGKVKDYYKKEIREAFLDEQNKKKLDEVAGDFVKKAEDLVKGTIANKVKNLGNSSADNKSGTDNAHNFTAQAIDDAGKLRRALITMCLYEREVMNKCLDLMYDNKPEKHGSLQKTFEQMLGPKPAFDAAALENFGKQYEINLYKGFYAKRGKLRYYIWRTPYRDLTTITVEDIPSAVLNRVKEIKKPATDEAAVRDWNLKKVYKIETAIPTAAHKL
ncbi:MAG: hypothetical protein M3209_15600 [Acidobacteriota bacterium]|nr:hypothetical protein [Acidobacteriota bacterium]